MKKLLLSSLLFFSVSMVNADSNVALKQVIDSEHRSDQNKKRDIYRHPLETLDFFEVDPNMSVIEIWPGGKAWYTEILAPYLKDNGILYAAVGSEGAAAPVCPQNRAYGSVHGSSHKTYSILKPI